MPATATPKKKSKKPSPSFVTGVIAFVFLIIGYQAALFVTRAGELRLVSNRDRPDTVYLIDRELAEAFLAGMAPEEAEALLEASPAGSRRVSVRREAPHSPAAERIVRQSRGRKTESFRFNPNTVSVEDLIRLGFSEKQAQAIDNYRKKGGRFRRPSDFARSYVVADSVFARLEPFIDIPRLDLNKADSAALTDLPGIGPYYAKKILEYRKALHGFSYKEQLLDLPRFEKEKYDGLSDLVFVSEPAPYPLWTLPEDSLKRHPYIGRAAHSLILYRNSMPRDAWTVEGLRSEGVLSAADADRLSRCCIAGP